MTNTIALLRNGNLDPVRYSGKNNPEITELEELLQRNLEKLETALDKNTAILFEKYASCVDEYIAVTCEQSFCDGFCLGAKILTESLHGAEALCKEM